MMIDRNKYPSKPGRACRGLLGALLIAVCSLSSGATNLPSLGEQALINIERETRLGRSVYERLLNAGLIETHPLLDRYINDLGLRLLAGIEALSCRREPSTIWRR